MSELALEMRPGTGAEFVYLLQLSSTWSSIVKTASDVIEANPNANAAEVYDHIQRTHVGEELNHVRCDLGELRKPITLNVLIERLTFLAIKPDDSSRYRSFNRDLFDEVSPLREYYAKRIETVPLWDFITYACSEVFGPTDTTDLRTAGKDWLNQVERLVGKLQFGEGIKNAGDLTLPDVRPYIEALLSAANAHLPPVESARINKRTVVESGGEITEPTHSLDFTSVNWFGTEYKFSAGLQAKSVKLLWEAWKNKTPTLSEKTIGENAGSSADNFRLAHVFCPTNKKLGKRVRHPAWETMIISKDGGLFALAPP